MNKKRKIAVVLFNLGAPDCQNSIKPFLFNFFMDKNIINLPIYARYLVASWIAYKRSKFDAKDIYKELRYKSPLLENTIKQAQVLEKNLNLNAKDIYKTFICMRYWHPMSEQVINEINEWKAERIILLPLYPQFSTTTTKSSLENWKQSISKTNIHNIETRTIYSYPENEGFIKASASNIAVCYKQAIEDGYNDIRILFCAHSLPEKIIRNGDSYKNQCERTAKKISLYLKEKLMINQLDCQNCYQSKIGPVKWIGPSVKDAIKQAVKDKTAIIIYPHSFTQEHVETLVELDIEYKEFAKNLGLKGYYRANTVGTHIDFIKGLTSLVLSI